MSNYTPGMETTSTDWNAGLLKKIALLETEAERTSSEATRDGCRFTARQLRKNLR